MKKKNSCHACHKHPAVRMLKVRHGRRTEEVELCDDCAHLWGIGPDETGLPFHMGDFYFPQIEDEDPENECPGCGSSLSDIRISGKAGCSECYGTFAYELIAILKGSDKQVQHTGRVPESLEILRTIIHKQHLRREQIHRALEQEDFEEAARLRDMEDQND